MPIPINYTTLYETDYLRWLETTVQKLRAQDYGNVDWQNLIEEIEDLGKSERRRLESNLAVILLHLLKWEFQPEQRKGGWEASIIEHRQRLNRALKDSPSLQPYLESIFAEIYVEARKRARAETGLPLDTFPTHCPYKTTEVLDDDFLPGEK
ncbi:MAG: DUF29 domain-containing protein [Symploca sp. SIO3C6]|nr:DUF29 domain-containing protein [Symploca sp. SIO3C6]